MKCPRRPSYLGFTLIELLVVVAIIALLISILLPSLRDAREQAKVAKCLAHCRQLTSATVQYLLDYDDNYPFWPNRDSGGPCSWAYGGKTPVEYWEGYQSGYYYYRVEERPMNPYLLGAEPEPDLMEGDRIIDKTEVPVLRCPSDTSSHQQFFWAPTPEVQGLSCYDDVGTSYQYNLGALFDVDWNGDRDPWEKPGDWDELGQLLVKNVLAKHSSTYVMYLPDPMDWGLAEWGVKKRSIEVGNHGKYGKHSLGFLDGHAAYTYCDTRGFCGVGWAAINPEWVRTWRHIPKPAHYYRWIGNNKKNCDPPVE